MLQKKETVWRKKRHYQVLEQLGATNPHEAYVVLYRLEQYGHKLALEHCEKGDRLEKLMQHKAVCKGRIEDLLPKLPQEAIKYNLDPRGNLLKVDDQYVNSHTEINFLRDGGGYGLLVPEI